VGSPAELRELLRKKRAAKVHAGAVYTDQPAFKRKGVAVQPQLRELVFDIDVNDYPELGVDVGDVASCDRVWDVVTVGMNVLKRLLREHFGFRNFLVTYSGRRGAHITVYDHRACLLSNEERRAIVAFLQPTAKKEETGRHFYGGLLRFAGFQKIYDDLIRPFFERSFSAPSSKGGLGLLDSEEQRAAFVAKLGLQGVSAALAALPPGKFLRAVKDAVLREAKKGCAFAEKALQETVMTYVFPRLDAAVSQSMGHLAKSVFSVHPKTGRISVPVFPNTGFRPEKCPTLEGVAGSAEGAREFSGHVEAFLGFVRKLAASPTEKWEPPRVQSLTSGVFNMRGIKRSREDAEEDNEWMYVDRSRCCYAVTRVFVAVASSANPNHVGVHFRTEVDEASATQRVFPGYAPPYRAQREFPVREFEDAVDLASLSPGEEVTCTRAPVFVLLHPRHADQLKVQARLERLVEEGLGEANLICSMDASCGSSVRSTISAFVKEVWETEYLFLS
jgi:DNA primase small subunit